MNPIRDEDLALAAAYLDGEMREPERARFELRLSAEPELAAHVEGLLRTDELVRRHTRRSAGAQDAGVEHRRTRLRLVPLLALAAAAILAIVALRARFGGAERQPSSPEIALLPSFESAAEWIARDPALAGQRPPGLDELRGANEEPNVEARAFVEAAQRSQARAFGATTTAESTAEFFALTLRVTEASDVLVFGFPARGAPIRYWPAPDDARPEAARLEIGDHVLPGASFRLVADPRGDRVEYERGFLVPIGAEHVEVLVATRTPHSSLDAGLLAHTTDRETTATRLRTAGFDVRTFTVREP